MTPGACFFTFPNAKTVRIRCTSDIANTSTIPPDLLSKPYCNDVSQIDLGQPISSLPPYLCTLPSGRLDLSFQALTVLDAETVSCLDNFHTVNLTSNQLTTVNMEGHRWTNLTSLDLSSNRLTSLPYSLLNQTGNSLRYLDLRNNSITAIDLLLYTLTNITIDLRHNPIDTSNIINAYNVLFLSTDSVESGLNILLTSSSISSTHVLNDQTVLLAGACNRSTVMALQSALRLTFERVVLDCSCASIHLKRMFAANGRNILDDFTCSDATSREGFDILTWPSCALTAVNVNTGLCSKEFAQVCSITF